MRNDTTYGQDFLDLTGTGAVQQPNGMFIRALGHVPDEEPLSRPFGVPPSTEPGKLEFPVGVPPIPGGIFQPGWWKKYLESFWLFLNAIRSLRRKCIKLLKDLQLEARAIEESAESHELSESEIEEEAENLKKSHDKSALVTSLMDNVGEFETLAEEVEGYEKIAKAYPVHADSTMYEIRGAILKMRLLKRKIEMQATALKLEIRPTPSSTGK